MTALELTGTISGGLITLLVAYKTVIEQIYKDYKERKKEEKQKAVRKQIEDKNGKTLDAKIAIYKMIRWLLKQYDCNRVIIAGFHDSGELLTGLCVTKVSIYYEDTASKTIKELEDLWQGRIVDFEMLRFMDFVNKDEFLHYEDIEMQAEDNIGIRELLNAKQGMEVYAVKIGWFGNDKLVSLIMQRDIGANREPLSMHHKAIINYKATEIKQLLLQSNLNTV